MADKVVTTVEVMLNAEAALRNVMGIKFDKPGGAKVRYHVLKLARLVDAEIKAFREAQNAVVKDYGYEREPTGVERAQLGPDKVWEVKPENIKQWRAEIKTLLAREVTIEWGPLTEEMLDPYPEATASDVFLLGPFYGG